MAAQYAQDLGDKTEADVVAVADEMAGFLPEDDRGNVDWDRAIDRIESAAGVDLGSDAESPLIEKIKRTVRQARRERM